MHSLASLSIRLWEQHYCSVGMQLEAWVWPEKTSFGIGTDWTCSHYPGVSILLLTTITIDRYVLWLVEDQIIQVGICNHQTIFKSSIKNGEIIISRQNQIDLWYPFADLLIPCSPSFYHNCVTYLSDIDYKNSFSVCNN